MIMITPINPIPYNRYDPHALPFPFHFSPPPKHPTFGAMLVSH
jgi:hypothetical protein